jgi:hypothetical protein
MIAALACQDSLEMIRHCVEPGQENLATTVEWLAVREK